MSPMIDDILDLITASVKGNPERPAKALADDIGKPYKTLMAELDESHYYKLGLRTWIKIMEVTHDLRSLDKIEERFNRVAFRLPRPEPGRMEPVMKMVGDLTKEFGEHMQELAKAMTDGRINKSEARSCLKELKDVIEACTRLQAYLEQLVK